MKPNEKNYIFSQIAQRFKQHPRFWDELQTQQYLFFANLNFVAIQFQQKNLTLMRYLEEFENNSIEIIYSSVLQFKNRQLQRMQFNKWMSLTIEYMIQQEEALGIAISQMNTQTQYINTFDDLQVIKDDKSNISQGPLSYASLQQDLRLLNPLYQRVLSFIIQDEFNFSKHNTNIPEEKEDELDDDSVQEYSDEFEEQIYLNNTNQYEMNENNETRIRQESKLSNQSCDQKEQCQSQNEQQELQLEVVDHLQEEEEVIKNENSSNLVIEDKKSSDLVIQSILDDITKVKQTDSAKQFKMSRTNSTSKEDNTQNIGLIEEKLSQIDLKDNDHLQLQNSEKIGQNQQKKILNQKKCSFEIDSQDINDQVIQKNTINDKTNKKGQNFVIQEQQSEENIMSNPSGSSIQFKSKSRKILSGIDVDKPGGINEDEVQRSSNKIIKKKNEEKNNQDERNKNNQSVKINRVTNIAKIDECIEDLIVKEVQQACLVLKDKQLIQWDKNDLQNIIIRSKYFQELTEVIEQNEIDGFMLFIVINEEMQLHDFPRLLNISFSTATKLKSFIQILEPLRSEQMLKISKKKKQIRIIHSSSIDGDFVIESPELKTRNSNILSSSNSRYIQNLIGIQAQQAPSITNTQKLNLSAFYGSNYLKNSSKFNTTDQLQDSSEYEEQKIQRVNKNIKNSIIQAEKSSSQMFEIQTRDKLLSSTSDQENQNQNFKFSSEQQQNNMMISEDKPQSNNTIFCYDSNQQWTNQKNRSPNYNKNSKAQFQSQILSASHNRTNLGLSSHFTSADNNSSYDERRNINSQPTLGTSFHFERQSCGVSAHNTTPATEKIPDDDNCGNSAITTAITAGIDSKDEFAMHPRLQKIKYIKLYPSKSTQLPNINLENQGTQYINSESQFETQNSIISNSTTPQNINTIHSAQIKGSYENITDTDQTPLSNQQMTQNLKHFQENNLGDSSYISTPLGFSQKVEKHVIYYQNQNRQNEGDEQRNLRKQSSNATLFQSELLDQQQQYQGQTRNNLVNSQQINILNKEQQTEQIQNQMQFFTQSDNFDQQIKLQSNFKGQDSNYLKFQPQMPISQPQQQSGINIQNNLQSNSNALPITQNQNSNKESNSFFDINSGDQHQQICFENPQTTPSFYPLPNPNNSRSNINDNNQNLQLQFVPFNQNHLQSDNDEIFRLKFQPEILQQFNYNGSTQNMGQSNNSLYQINQNQQNTPVDHNTNQTAYNQQLAYNQQVSSDNTQNFVKDNNSSVRSIKLPNIHSIQSQNQVNSNNLIQLQTQNQQNQIQGQIDIRDLKFNFGNSVSFTSFPNQSNQEQQQTNSFQNQQFNNNQNIYNQNLQNYQQQNLYSQIPISNSQSEGDKNQFENSNNNYQQQNQMIQQQHIPYQQGNSFICYQNNNNNYMNQFNNQTNIYQNQNYVQGNSISFQQPQQFIQQNIQQNQNNFQGNSISFLQPNINYGMNEVGINQNQIQQQNNGYIQGSSIYFPAGNQMYQQQQNQQNLQQNNQFISQQMNIQQNNQGYSNYFYQPQIDPQYNNNQYNLYQNNQQNNNNNQYYIHQQQYYQEPYNQNNMQQYQQENQGNNMGLKLPTIFLMDNTQNNNFNEQAVHNQQNAYQQDTSQDNQSNQATKNQSSDNQTTNIQLQKILKLQAKHNQVLKCTYNLPFNLFKFDVIPKIKVDIKGKSSDQHLKFYTFHSEGATIGRNVNNSINFIEELSISAYHAIIFYQKREFFIQDIKSKAGTFVKIKSIPITNDLKLKLGEVEIKFIKCEKGIVTFQTSSSSLKKGTIDLNQKSEVKMGRCKLRCDYVLQDQGNTVSFVHAQIHYNEQKQICITDLGSGNGTWLRLSEKSCRSNPYKLNLNDQIMISNTKKIVIMELES